MIKIPFNCFLVCETPITNSIKAHGESILIRNFAWVFYILFKCQFPSSG